MSGSSSSRLAQYLLKLPEFGYPQCTPSRVYAKAKIIVLAQFLLQILFACHAQLIADRLLLLTSTLTQA